MVRVAAGVILCGLVAAPVGVTSTVVSVPPSLQQADVYSNCVVGSSVTATRAGTANNGATIDSVNEDGTITVNWRDGETSDRIVSPADVLNNGQACTLVPATAPAQVATVTVNPSASTVNERAYADAADPACNVPPAPSEITACTGGVPGTIALNRGMCVNNQCWDVCNPEHAETAYVGTGFDANLTVSVPDLILMIRNGNSPNVSCPPQVVAEADRATCGDHGRAGDRCTPLGTDNLPRTEDRTDLGMCIIPNDGLQIECRDMCGDVWPGDGWRTGLTETDIQQVDDVQSSWACGYPWHWLWYLLLFLLVIACILAVLFFYFKLRKKGGKKQTRALREPEPPFVPEPEPMNYTQPQAPPVEVPQMGSIRLQQPMLIQQPQQQYIQTMAPQVTTMQPGQLTQSGTRGSVSQQGTFYNPMQTRMPNYAYQGVPGH